MCRTVLHVLWLKLLNLVLSHLSSDLCTGSRLTNALNYKLLPLTDKVLTTSQPDYLHNLISVQSSGRTRSSSVVTLARPSVSSSLQITNLSWPDLWNQLPSSFRQPPCVHSPPGSPHPAHITIHPISPHHSHHLRSHHLSLPRPFTPDLKLMSFTNPFLHVTLIPSGLPSRILTCTVSKGHWRCLF